jgi:hypothetical protein
MHLPRGARERQTAGDLPSKVSAGRAKCRRFELDLRRISAANGSIAAGIGPLEMN